MTGVLRKAVDMVQTADRTSLFQTELLAQWRAACAALRAAEAEGDGWLADLMAGRLEDLRDLIRYHGVLDLTLGTA